MLRADIRFRKGESRAIVLMDNVTFFNRSTQSPLESKLTYCIGESCYVNLTGLRPADQLQALPHKTSLSGFSFFRCNGPDKVLQLVETMDSELYPAMSHAADETDRPSLGEYLWNGEFYQSMGIFWLGNMHEMWTGAFKEGKDAFRKF